MDRHCRRHQWALSRLRDEAGQSTVEYALVLAAFLALIIALGALWHFFSDGAPLHHALASASHHVSGVPLPFLADIFRY